jgi:hypothetical protein
MRTYHRLGQLVNTGRCKQYEDHAIVCAQTASINQAMSTAKETTHTAHSMMIEA